MNAQSTTENETQKENLIAKYLHAQVEGGEAAAKHLRNLAAKLNNLYWKTVEDLIATSLDLDSLSFKFDTHASLLIDFGLLDVRLVKNAPENFAQELLAERQIAGLPKHFYLTEWLGDRLKRYEIETAIATTQAEKDAENFSTRYVNAYSDLENYLAKKYAGTGIKLPGISETALAAMLSGRLDQQIIAMGANLLGKRQRAGLLNRNRLVRLRYEIISKFALPSEANSLIEAVQRIYRAAWQKEISGQGRAKSDKETPESLDSHKSATAIQWLIEELKFVRAVMPLGAFAGGISRPCSVMFEYRQRVTRKHTQALIERMPWCDRNCQTPPVVLIAPFTGRGVYEWDRDSLVIGVLPTDGPEDAVANAVANYSMMLDSLQQHAAIRSLYQTAFPKVNFQQSFQRDYRQWLVQVGDGDLAALPPEKLDFFADVVAPEFINEPAVALAPPELRALSPTMRTLLRKQIQNQAVKNNWRTRYRLAVLLWQDRNYPEALTEMANAANLAPKEFHTAFCVGLLLIENGQREKAKPFLAALAERAAQTIWKFHITRVLERLI